MPSTAMATAPAPPTLAELIAGKRSSVVRISASTCDGESIGSGFIIGDRLVATVFHVVDGAQSIRISTPGGAKGDAVVVGYDRDRDLALLRADGGIPGDALTFSSTGPPVGSDVVTLGYPLRLPLTATRGTVTGLHRRIDVEGVDHRGLLQTDAAVNPGNSGGPVIDAAGGVVAIVVAGGEGYQGIGFGIPRQRAQPLPDGVGRFAGAGGRLGALRVRGKPRRDRGPGAVDRAAGGLARRSAGARRRIVPRHQGRRFILEAANDPLTGNAYFDAGEAYLLLGDCASAVPYLERSIGLGTPQQNAIR